MRPWGQPNVSPPTYCEGMQEPELVPLPQRRRNELPRWAVMLDGVRVGEVETVRLGGAVSTFYKALGVLPGWRGLVDLELDTDLDGQARKLVEFSRDPRKFWRHLTFPQRKIFFGQEESGASLEYGHGDS